MQLSLLFFSSNESSSKQDKYHLLQQATTFADQHPFKAIWLPERHFHPFGGLYPNPSVLAANLASTTTKIRLRAGSIVLPLHNPVRVAEDWAVVDNLSNGRVDLSFATGWNPNDFVLSPHDFANRVNLTFTGIETIKKLWGGGTINLPNPDKKNVEIKIFPSPQQTSLTTWLTCTGGVQRFKDAGQKGFNVLTALLFQSTSELAEKILLYRQAYSSQDNAEGRGHVTLMLHCYLDDTLEAARQQTEVSLMNYLSSSIDLWRQDSQPLAELSTNERNIMLNYAYENFYQTKTLMGTVQSCKQKIEQLKAIEVDEIACLIDFGVERTKVLRSLKLLSELTKE